MKCLSDAYAKVFSHKGFDICTLKIAIPKDGDSLGYAIDHKVFSEQTFNLVEDAINYINMKTKKGDKKMEKNINLNELTKQGINRIVSDIEFDSDFLSRCTKKEAIQYIDDTRANLLILLGEIETEFKYS